MINFRSPYVNPPPPDEGAVSSFPEEGAKQEFQQDCDLNRIMAKYAQTGALPPAAVAPVFGDFSDVGDFLENNNRVKAAHEAFMSLSAQVRERFHNDPAKLIAFVHDEANAAEARELGLLELKEVPPGTVIVETLRTIAENTKPAIAPAKEDK